MTNVGEIVARLIAAGAPPEVAAMAVCEAFQMGAASGNSGGIPVDETAEKRRAYDRERKRNKKLSGGIPVEVGGIPMCTSFSIESKKERKRERGTRIPPDWEPSSADIDAAKSDGLTDGDISKEKLKFRDYWSARAGRGGVKLDWSATWRNWCRRAAEYLGRSPPVSSTNVVPIGHYAAFGSAELDAWDAHNRKTNGLNMPRDKRGGWLCPSRWPPGHESQSATG